MGGRGRGLGIGRGEGIVVLGYGIRTRAATFVFVLTSLFVWVGWGFDGWGAGEETLCDRKPGKAIMGAGVKSFRGAHQLQAVRPTASAFAFFLR